MPDPNYMDDPELEERLRTERPLPAPAFRGDLRRRLVRMGRTGVGRPRHLRVLIASYGLSGAALLVIGAAGLAGAGPFAA
jgi:hypothetical protein